MTGVYLHIIGDEVRYYVEYGCNCKDCVTIEPKPLTPREHEGEFKGAPGADPRQLDLKLFPEDG